MAAEIEANRMMLYHVCRMQEQGIPFAKEATMVKMLSSEMCVRVCDKGVQIMGGYGLCEEYELERFYRYSHALLPRPKAAHHRRGHLRDLPHGGQRPRAERVLIQNLI